LEIKSVRFNLTGYFRLPSPINLICFPDWEDLNWEKELQERFVELFSTYQGFAGTKMEVAWNVKVWKYLCVIGSWGFYIKCIVFWFEFGILLAINISKREAPLSTAAQLFWLKRFYVLFGVNECGIRFE
jgi:hypothetical protein